MTADGAKRTGRDMPVGREQVSAAILAAAADLFAERGPASTSIRDIAARSGVNHGLVFRHFGTKEQLIGAVLDHLGQNLTTLVERGAPPEDLEAALDRHWRVMARALLDGFPAAKLQARFPTIELMLDQVRPRHSSDFSARMAVANAAALQLGWRLFEPFLRAATGIEELPESQLRELVGSEMARIVEPH